MHKTNNPYILFVQHCFKKIILYQNNSRLAKREEHYNEEELIYFDFSYLVRYRPGNNFSCAYPAPPVTINDWWYFRRWVFSHDAHAERSGETTRPWEFLIWEFNE